MAVCPRCNGNGSVLYPIDYEQGLFDETNCDLCGGSGEVLTNEEWFTSLSTEEKADKLTDFSFWLVPTIPTDEKCEQIKQKIVEWLKQPHNSPK